MKYFEITPESAELSQYIECLWVCNNFDEHESSVSVVPDTCTDIIIRSNSSNEPELFISGEMTKATNVPIRHFSVQFQRDSTVGQ